MGSSHTSLARHWRRGALALAALACCTLETGCVQRRLTIRSNPPGAVVYVGNQEIGTTPISHDFIYYGSREITLVKDGYETLKVKAELPTPWYDLPGIDFVSENLIPSEIRDHRVLDFQLQPQVIVPTEQLMGRAEELRRLRNNQVTAPAALPGVGNVPPAAAAPGVAGPGTIAPGTLSPAQQGLPIPPPGAAVTPYNPPVVPPVVAPPSSPTLSPARPATPLGPPSSLGAPGSPPPTGF
jgi:hypothetical protein